MHGLDPLSNKVWIYFIRAGEKGAIKIGYTEDSVENRMKQMQTGCPDKLKIFGRVKAYRMLENALHRVLAEYHIHGEWFEPSERVLAYATLARAGMADALYALAFDEMHLERGVDQINPETWERKHQFELVK